MQGTVWGCLPHCTGKSRRGQRQNAYSLHLTGNALPSTKGQAFETSKAGNPAWRSQHTPSLSSSVTQSSACHSGPHGLRSCLLSWSTHSFRIREPDRLPSPGQQPPATPLPSVGTDDQLWSPPWQPLAGFSGWVCTTFGNSSHTQLTTLYDIKDRGRQLDMPGLSTSSWQGRELLLPSPPFGAECLRFKCG